MKEQIKRDIKNHADLLAKFIDEGYTVEMRKSRSGLKVYTTKSMPVHIDHVKEADNGGL